MPIDMKELFQFLPDMVEIISESEHDKKEMGFMICKDDDGSLHREEHCVGDTCDVELKDCDTGENYADFHTHLTEVVETQSDKSFIDAVVNGWHPEMVLRGLVPSSGDLFAGWLRQVKASCIGNARGICCHEVKEHEDLTEVNKSLADEITQNRADWIVGRIEENTTKIAKAFSWYMTLVELVQPPDNDKFFGDSACHYIDLIRVIEK